MLRWELERLRLYVQQTGSSRKCRPVILRLVYIRNLLEVSLKQITGPQSFWFRRFKWSLRIYIYNKFPGDADALAQELHLRSAELVGCAEIHIYVNVWFLHTIGDTHVHIKLHHQATRHYGRRRAGVDGEGKRMRGKEGGTNQRKAMVTVEKEVTQGSQNQLSVESRVSYKWEKNKH